MGAWLDAPRKVYYRAPSVMYRLGPLVLASVTLSCQPIERTPPRGASTASPPPVEDYNPPVHPRSPTAEVPEVPTAAMPPPSRGAAIAWPSTLRARSWDDAIRDARTRHRPVLVVVYANWCPHCHELAPLFADPEVVRLAQQMDVVFQDADQTSATLAQSIQSYGQYVPRVFFFRSDGTVRADITSPNSRFPYFYTPGDLAALRASMHRALES